MCIRDSIRTVPESLGGRLPGHAAPATALKGDTSTDQQHDPVSYTHLRAHETVLDLVCRLLLEKKHKQNKKQKNTETSQSVKTQL